MANILSVKEGRIYILKSNPPQWSVKAEGIAATPNWSNPRLEQRYYINFPEDGIQDFDFVADPPSGIVNQVLSPITAYADWVNVPEYVKGVRIHSKFDSIEILSNSASSFN